MRPSDNRRYDVDAVRVFALLLLIFTHAQAAFSEAAPVYRLIAPSTAVSDSAFFRALDFIYLLVSIWRIPILFVVAGMAARFSLAHRTLAAFSVERFRRIGIPLLFGSLVVFPIALYLSMSHYKGDGAYVIATGHLWFLVNILIYVCLLVAVVWLLGRLGLKDGRLSRLPRDPRILVAAFAVAVMALAAILNPERFGDWTDGRISLVFGLLCFIGGYGAAAAGDAFRQWTERRAGSFLASAVALFVFRLMAIGHDIAPLGLALPRNLLNAAVGLEMTFWILAVMAYFARLVKTSTPALRYATAAVFPVYIVHYPIQNALAWSIQDALGNRVVLFLLLIALETLACLLVFEGVRRIRGIRVLFGMRA
ncbi:MAG: acyltransferase family protein [Alphaproteobacteria bacterium]|nr:acyltransferase family protein [Alphaproteobacteria bacterium]